MHRRGVLAALAVAPGLLVSLFFLAGDLPQFFDPCHSWGAGNPSTLSPDAECPSRSATSETRAGAITRILLLHGGVLGALSIGAWGILSARGDLAVTGAWLLTAISIPLMWGFGAAPVLLSGALVLLAAGLTGVLRGASAWAARLLAVLVALFYILQMGAALASGISAFQAYTALLLLIPLLMLAGAWWPHARALEA